MGNCCGKAESDNFSAPGRVLSSAPPRQTTASVPAGSSSKPKLTVGGPPRTLGGGGGYAAQSSADDARRKAAEAAEARAKGKPIGKLGEQLAAQKKQTRTETLNQASEEERRRRDLDESARALSHN